MKVEGPWPIGRMKFIVKAILSINDILPIKCGIVLPRNINILTAGNEFNKGTNKNLTSSAGLGNRPPLGHD